MTDSYRLPFASPGNSHDFEEGITSTKEWQEMTWDTQFPAGDPTDPSKALLDPTTGLPIFVPQNFEKDYRSLTHQGRIRICNDYFLPNGGSFASFLAPETKINPQTKKFDTPHFNERGWFPDPHEYFLDDGKIKVRLRASASEKPVGEFITVSPDEIGTTAHQALAAYLAALNNDVSDSGAEKTESGFVMEDSTDVKPDSEKGFRDKIAEAKTSGKSQVEFTFNDALESIFGKSTLQECFVSLVRYGYFKEATSVDIKNLKVSFTLKAAENFLDQVFGQKYLENYQGETQGETISDYTGPTSSSIQYYFYGGADKRTNHFDSVMESMAVYRARENAFTTPIEKTYDYTTVAAAAGMTFGTVKDEYKAHTLYLPVLYNTKTKQVEVVTGPLAQLQDGTSFVDAAWFKDNSTVTDGFNLPPGYRLPTEEELVGFREMSESNPIATPPDAAYADSKITIVNDENMFVLNTTANGNTLPLLAVAQFYQPVTNFQLAPLSDRPEVKADYPSYNDVDSWMADNIWMTYEEAFALAALTDQAPGVAMTMRRRNDLGFRYEYLDPTMYIPGIIPGIGNSLLFGSEPIANASDLPYMVGFPGVDINFPGSAIDAVTGFAGISPEYRKKVACYAVKYDQGTFAGAYKILNDLLNNTEGDLITLPNGMTIMRNEAQELLSALANADRGSLEGIVKFIRSTKWGTVTIQVVIGLLTAGVFIWGGYKMQQSVGNKPLKPVDAQKLVEGMTKNEVEAYKAALASGQYNDAAGRFSPIYVGRKKEMTDVLRQMLTIIENHLAGLKEASSMQITAPAGQGKSQFMEQIAFVLARGYLPPSAEDFGTANWPSGTPLTEYFTPAQMEMLNKIRIRTITMDGIKEGTMYSGTFERKLKALEIVAESDPYSFFALDELADNATAGGDLNDPTSTLTKLKSILASRLKMITTLTPQSLRKMAESMQDGNQIMSRFTKAPNGQSLPLMDEKDIALNLYLKAKAKFDKLRGYGVDISAMNLSQDQLLAMCRGTGDNFFSGFIEVMRPKGLSGGLPRVTAIAMNGYLTNLESRAARGESVAASVEDFAKYIENTSDTDTDAVKEGFQEAVQSLIYNKLKFTSKNIKDLIAKHGLPFSELELLQGVMKKGDDEDSAVYFFRMNEVVRSLKALISRVDNTRWPKNANAVQAKREEFFLAWYKILQEGIEGSEDDESNLDLEIDEQNLGQELLESFDENHLEGFPNAQSLFRHLKNNTDDLSLEVKTRLAIIFSPIPGEDASERTRRLRAADALCNQLIRTLGGGRTLGDDEKHRVWQDFFSKLDPMTNEALRIRQALAASAAARPASTTVAAASAASTRISDDPIAKLRTILEKYGLNYTRFGDPDVAREFFLIFNIANSRIYIGNTNEARESLLKQALQKASLVDADTSKTVDEKKSEIEEIFVRAALEAGRMLTGDEFDREVKGTKIEAYARSKGWPEVRSLKDSEILDKSLFTFLQKHHLAHDVVELNATVYAGGPELKKRLDILKTALVQIQAIDTGSATQAVKQTQIKDALMRAMLTAGKTIPDFDITKTPKLNAYAAEQGWPEAVNAAKDIVTNVNAFFFHNSQSGTVRQYAKQQYEDLEIRYKIKMPDADPQAVLLFAQVDSTHNKANANTETHIHFKIDEYVFKLVVLRAYAQYMNNTQFLSKSDDEKLAQAQAEFVKTLRATKGFATKKPGSTPEDAKSDLDKNLATFAQIMAENMVALSQKARSRR